jgi:glycosyltransferase involved in cell wall biosynthesis
LDYPNIAGKVKSKVMNKISVIVPIYKVEKYLTKCLDSIINQSYKNLEIILVDDGSPDNCPVICDEYAKRDNRIKVIHKRNSGLSAARNTGIKMASGDYVSFIDSDDWLDQGTFEHITSSLKDNRVDCLRMGYYKNNDIFETIVKLNVRKGLYEKDNFSELIDSFITGKEPCFSCLLIIKRETLQKTNLFDENMMFLEDYCFFFELLGEIDDIYITSTPLYHYRYNPNSLCQSPDNYDRNMKALLNVHVKTTKTLSDGGYYTNEIRKNADTTHTIMSSGFLFKVYKNNVSDIAKMSQMFIYLNNDTRYREMAKNVDWSKIPYHIRYDIKCTLNGNLKSLIRFFKIRLVASKLKDAVREYIK